MLRTTLAWAAFLGVACSGQRASPTEPVQLAEAGDKSRVDLASYGVVANDPSRASQNREAIQKAIDDNTGKNVVLMLPVGAIYLDRGAHFDSLRFGGVSNLTLAGRGVDSRIVIAGDAGGGYWVGIEVFDGAQKITLRDFSIEHGDIAHPSPTQQDHLIQLNAQYKVTSDIELQNVRFGPCIGDALRIAGTSPNYVSHVKVHDIAMYTNGHPQAPRNGSRSGIALQRGFKDVEIYDFYLYGAKNSPIDMEPSAAAPMDNLNIHDGVVDNSGGTTVFAVSLGGWESPDHVVSPLRNSKFHHVVILEGQMTILDTESLEISDVMIYASGKRGPMASAKEPLIYVNHENKNLRLARVNMMRDIGAGTGGLLLVTHGTETFPSNIEIDGGTWVSRVDPQIKGTSYVAFESVHDITMKNVRLQLEGSAPEKQYAIRFRSGARDIQRVKLHDLTITSRNGKLAAGIWMAATNSHAIQDVHIKGVTAANATNYGVLFDALDGSTVEPAPVLEGNDFGNARSEWTAAHAAQVSPVLKGKLH